MALFTRVIFGLLLFVLYSVTMAHQGTTYNADLRSYLYCDENVPEHFIYHCGNASQVSRMIDECQTPSVNHEPHPESWTCSIFDEGSRTYYLHYECESGDYISGSLRTWVCSDVPPDEPECDIPVGSSDDIVSSSPLGSSTCYQNCQMTTRTSGSVPWIEVNGSRMYFYTATSTGDYCDSSSGAAPAQPWDNYTDDDGCYMGFDGRYCSAGGGDCPNSVTAPNGERFCRMPPDQDDCNEAGGSSGDAYCGQDDPDYEEPVPGDGDDGGDDQCDPQTEDCSPDGGDDGGDDGGGAPGDPGGDGDGDDHTNAPGDGELVGGECTQDTRRGPDCSDNMNATECAFGLQLWQARCDQKLAHEDIVGTDEYREGDSLLSESDANQVGTSEVDFSEALSDLDDSGAGFGGAASCPADRTINLAGFGTVKIPMTFICQWAEKIRPLIIALGWLSAGLIVLSSMRGK